MFVAVLAVNYLARHGFLRPSANSWIDDDARQFLSWSARIADPHALPGDLLADYWQAVTPVPFQWLLHAFAAVGVDPVMAVKIIPLLLLPLTAVLAWKVAMALMRHPLTAFLAASLVLLMVARADNLMSGTPPGVLGAAGAAVPVRAGAGSGSADGLGDCLAGRGLSRTRRLCIRDAGVKQAACAAALFRLVVAHAGVAWHLRAGPRCTGAGIRFKNRDFRPRDQPRRCDVDAKHGLAVRAQRYRRCDRACRVALFQADGLCPDVVSLCRIC